MKLNNWNWLSLVLRNHVLVRFFQFAFIIRAAILGLRHFFYFFCHSWSLVSTKYDSVTECWVWVKMILIALIGLHMEHKSKEANLSTKWLHFDIQHVKTEHVLTWFSHSLFYRLIHYSYCRVDHGTWYLLIAIFNIMCYASLKVQVVKFCWLWIICAVTSELLWLIGN